MKQPITNMEEIDLPEFHAPDSEWDDYFRLHYEEAKAVQWQFTTVNDKRRRR